MNIIYVISLIGSCNRNESRNSGSCWYFEIGMYYSIFFGIANSNFIIWILFEIRTARRNRRRAALISRMRAKRNKHRKPLLAVDSGLLHL